MARVKSTTKVGELREKSPEELKAALQQMQKEQFVLRMQAATGQLGQPHLVRSTRREIARIKTVLGEMAASNTGGQSA